MFENIYLDFATISAVVAAFVSVVGNAFNIHAKYRAVLAIIVGVGLVVMPAWLMEKTVTALLIGLTASGVYTQVKKREYPPGGNPANSNSQPKETIPQNTPFPSNIKGPEDV